MTNPKKIPKAEVETIMHKFLGEMTVCRTPTLVDYYSRTFNIYETKRVKLVRDIEARGERYRKGEFAYLRLQGDKTDYVMLPWENADDFLTLVEGTPIEGKDFEFI